MVQCVSIDILHMYIYGVSLIENSLQSGIILNLEAFKKAEIQFTLTIFYTLI